MKKTLILFFSLLGYIQLSAQDKHFSMWYASPSLLNPAATATMAEDFQFFTNFRMQWLTAADGAFRTNAFSAEAKLGKDRLSNGYFGAGLHFYNDAAGSHLSTNSVSIPLNYVFNLNRNNIFSVGVLPGVYQQSMNSDQTWNSQWDGLAFNPSLSNAELMNRSFMRFDLGAGLFYQWSATETASKFHIGFASNHLTRQNVNLTTTQYALDRSYTAHAGANIRYKYSKVGFSPMVYTFFQGKNKNIVFGTSIDLLLKDAATRTVFRKEQSISLGLYHRLNDAVIVSFMYKNAGLQAGLSYDANLSALKSYTKSIGAFELFLRYALYRNPRTRLLH